MPQQTKFTCTVCWHDAESLQDLEKHWAIHLKHYYDDPEEGSEVPNTDSRADTIQCNVCTFKARYNFMIQRHMKKVHERVKCPHCKYEVAGIDELSRHAKSHIDGEKEVISQNMPLSVKYTRKCPKCTFEATTSDDIYSHLKSHHYHGNIQVPPQPTHLGVGHIRGEQDKASPVRDYSRKAKPSSAMPIQRLDDSSTSHAKTTPVPTELEGPSKTHTSTPETAARIWAESLRMTNPPPRGRPKRDNKHPDEPRPRAADVFDIGLPEPATHPKQHYRCEICTFKGRSDNEVQLHVKVVHLGMKILGCELCSFTCQRKYYLERHKRLAHVTKESNHHCSPQSICRTINAVCAELSCGQCSYKTGYRSNLLRHKSAEHGLGRIRKELRCSHCSFTTCFTREFTHHTSTCKILLSKVDQDVNTICIQRS